MRKNPTPWNANEPGRNWHLEAFFGLHYDCTPVRRTPSSARR